MGDAIAARVTCVLETTTAKADLEAPLLDILDLLAAAIILDSVSNHSLPSI